MRTALVCGRAAWTPARTALGSGPSPTDPEDAVMLKLVAPAPWFAAITLIASAAISTAAEAQTAPAFEKKHYNYAEWAKGRFSEAVTVTGPAKMIFLAGVGSEHEQTGKILYAGDFDAQCRYAFLK